MFFFLMKEGRHHVKMKWLNRKKDYIIRINDIMYYSEKKEHERLKALRRRLLIKVKLFESCS